MVTWSSFSKKNMKVHNNYASIKFSYKYGILHIRVLCTNKTFGHMLALQVFFQKLVTVRSKEIFHMFIKWFVLQFSLS